MCPDTDVCFDIDGKIYEPVRLTEFNFNHPYKNRNKRLFFAARYTVFPL